MQVMITKEFHFEMAHALWNYDGDCSNIHGHSYKLYVTVAGNPVTEEGSPKLGMVIDFSELKEIVYGAVISRFDHALALNSRSVGDNIHAIRQMCNKLEVLDYQPTCENIVVDIAGRISRLLPVNVKLLSLKLQETENSYAEWFASDNPDLNIAE